MIELCLVWRRDDPKQSALEAIAAGARRYLLARGQMPNFVNAPPGMLTETELAQLRERMTVETTAPAYFQDEIWLGVLPLAPSNGGSSATEIHNTTKGE